MLEVEGKNMKEIDSFKYVYQILNLLDENSLKKVPQDLYNKIKKIAMKSNKNFEIDNKKKLVEQDIPYEVKVLLKYVYMMSTK